MNQPAPVAASASGRRVAIVSRLDDAARDAASAFVSQMGLEPMHVQTPAAGGDASFIDRLDGVRGADYALVLVPASDLGTGGQGSVRPEILLEIGFLFGAVGRRRVCFVPVGPLALSPELEGVIVRHQMDAAGLWRLLLAREMKQAGLDVDMNRAL